MVDPSNHLGQLASDRERDAVIDRLRTAGAEGRLTLEELGERVEAASGARTGGELAVLTEDLPAPAAGAAPAVAASADPEPRRWMFALIGGADRKGRWRVPRRLTSITLIGGPDLDLREATLAGPEAEITVFTLIGGADVIVPPGIAVELSGFTLIGGDDVKLTGPPPPPGAPTVRIRTFGLIGGTDVKDSTRRDRRARTAH
jgi:uncharacterized protein DUF1707